MSSPYRTRMNLTYSPTLQNSEKDLIISQLKAQIFELEQNEKNFNSLTHKFRNIQGEFTQLSEEKLRMEFDHRQKTDGVEKINHTIQLDNDSLRHELTEKVNINKKLYSDNENFYNFIEKMKHDKTKMSNDLQGLHQQINLTRTDLMKQENDLKNSNFKIQNTLTELNTYKLENDKLIRLLHEEKSVSSQLISEKEVTNKKLDQLKTENHVLNSNVQHKEEAVRI